MTTARIEHANITVADPAATAQQLCELFGWHVRWEGPSLNGGFTVHVGADDNYLAIYSPGEVKPATENYSTSGGLNHIGVLVDDLEETLGKIRAAGIETFNHADYEPGRRFYFHNPDGIEFEVVSYA